MFCHYCSNCTKFGQLILRKIIKIVATRCHILRLKCTKFDFGWGTYSAPPSPLAGLSGPLSNGKKGREGEGRDGKEGKREASDGKKVGTPTFWMKVTPLILVLRLYC